MVTKQEIEVAIKDKDDFVKLDYLRRFMKQADSMDLKKFILLNLVAIYEKKGMLTDAIRDVAAAADISVIYKDKRELYMKEVELWIKYGDFDFAEKALRKALYYGTNEDKKAVQQQYVNLYRANGKALNDKGAWRKAIDVYEKLFSMDVEVEMKREIRNTLLDLYDKTGRIRDYSFLKSREI